MGHHFKFGDRVKFSDDGLRMFKHSGRRIEKSPAHRRGTVMNRSNKATYVSVLWDADETGYQPTASSQYHPDFLETAEEGE